MVDMAHIAGEVPEDAWAECGSDPADIRDCAGALRPLELTLSPVDEIPCGVPLTVVRQNVLPFSYASLTRERKTHVQLVRVDCE